MNKTGQIYCYFGKDHLGNVQTTISDHRIAVPIGSNLNYYIADVISSTDYYPFGSPMPGRNSNLADYRFGFNGKEKVDELFESSGSAYDFGARLNDARLGKWMKRDPLFSKYVAISPYAFAGNSPAYFSDVDGRKLIGKTKEDYKKFYAILQKVYADNPEMLSYFKAAKNGREFAKMLGVPNGKGKARGPEISTAYDKAFVGNPNSSMVAFLESHGIDPESDMGVFTRELIELINDDEFTVEFTHTFGNTWEDRSHCESGPEANDGTVNNYTVYINASGNDYNEDIMGGAEVFIDADNNGVPDDANNDGAWDIDQMCLSVGAKSIHEIFESYANKGLSKAQYSDDRNMKITDGDTRLSLYEKQRAVSLYTMQMENLYHRVMKEGYQNTGGYHKPKVNGPFVSGRPNRPRHQPMF